MHDIRTFTKIPVERAKRLTVGKKIELLTYKKDRKVVIIKKDIELFEVIEDGFEHKKFENVGYGELEGLLKKLRDVEFPRSNTYFLR